MTKQFSRRWPRHPFRWVIPGLDGKEKMISVYTPVTLAKDEVELTLTADDVRKSIEEKGAGNAMTCAMAQCVHRNSTSFSHPVIGAIEWTTTGAFIVTKLSPRTGMPTRCIKYWHRDKVARLNDSPGGQKKLLKIIEANGPLTVTLLPAKHRPYQPRSNGEARNGNKTRQTFGIGASARFTYALLRGAVKQ